MLLNVKQAAQLMKVTRGAIYSAIRKGLIADQKPRVNGKAKHYSLLLDKDVKELNKTHVYMNRRWHDKSLSGNVKPKVVSPTIFPANLPSPVGTLSRLESKVDKIQETLNTLLKLWS